MPIYKYKCVDCLEETTELQNINDAPLEKCKCGGGLKKIISSYMVETNYSSGKEYYENIIKPDVKRVVDKIKSGDENATADVFGEKYFNKE